MTEETKITLPKLGESIHSATVVQWFKKVGDQVVLDEPLLEVSTDKVNSEIPSPVAGVIKAILAGPDQEVQVGEPLAVIAAMSQDGLEVKSGHVVADNVKEPQKASSEEMKGFYSPSILRLAQEKGIAMEELEKIPGTGAGGRLSRKDVDSYLEKQTPGNLPCEGTEVEHVKMTGMRKAIAANMVRSFYEAPHASLVSEVDVTEPLAVIQREKLAFQEKYGCKLTITSFVIRALINALKEYPLLNSSLHDDTIVVKHFVNLGVAVSVSQGLMVPVITGVHRKSLSEIAKSVADLSHRARENQLKPDEVREGTITLSNFGMAGVTFGVPIIRYPEVAIIGMAAIQKKIIVMPDETTAIRCMVNISLTFDHRVLDGMYGCGFMQTLKNHLENDLVIN
jgi:2-oxoglutarate dehydrogenase E2 component (dihydrolipoamide succinyltransferase)